MSIVQRENIKKIIKNGDPLPGSPKMQTKIKVNSIIHKPKSSKKRTQSAIIESGAYEREKFTPIRNKGQYLPKRCYTYMI